MSNHDLVLAGFAEGLTKNGGEFAITVVTGGRLISGTVVGPTEWLNLLALSITDAWFSGVLLEISSAIENDVLAVTHIHMKDCVAETGPLRGALFRVDLAHISAWSFGRIG